jgi:hypothetical protein
MKDVIEKVLNDASVRDEQGVAQVVRDVDATTQDTPWL